MEHLKALCLLQRQFTVDGNVKASRHNSTIQDQEILCFDLGAIAGSELCFATVQTNLSGCCFFPHDYTFLLPSLASILVFI